MTSIAEHGVFTIGHSDNSVECFIEMLRAHGIRAVHDVRSTPYSRFHPQFNREQLQAALKFARIEYLFLGDELGARRAEPECYVDGKAKYELIARTRRFKEGLRRVVQDAGTHRVALMCAEKDPITCHRAILVCRHLKPTGVRIAHILEDGELESTSEMERRLLDVAGNGSPNLFASQETLLEEAYDVQGDRIAYTPKEEYAVERG